MRRLDTASSVQGFFNAKLLVEILKRMGNNLNKARIMDVVENLENLDIGIDAPVTFGVNKHQGLDKVYFTTVQDEHSYLYRTGTGGENDSVETFQEDPPSSSSSFLSSLP